MVAVEESKVWSTNPVLFRPIINRARQIRASLGELPYGWFLMKEDEYGGLTSTEGSLVRREV
jgi:hypothetical protein